MFLLEKEHIAQIQASSLEKSVCEELAKIL